MTEASVTTKEHFLSQRQRYQPISLPQHFSDEEVARDWTLLERDRQEIERYRKDSRLYMAIQICAVRLYGPDSSDLRVRFVFMRLSVHPL